MESEPPRVLVIFPGALGDLICLMPALGAIRARHRAADVALIAKAELARFAVGRMSIDRAYSIDRREVSLLFNSAPESLMEARSFFGQFDRIYSFLASGDSGYRHNLERAAGGGVSFHRFRPDGDGHVSAGYLHELSETGAHDAAYPALTVLDSDLDAAAAILRARSLTQNRFVLMLPGSGSPAKNWPAGAFANLAARLDMPSLVVLGPVEAGFEQFFAAHSVPIAKELELGTLAGLARMAAIFVGNDSGVSHLAAAAGACGVVMFGLTDPARWRPLGNVRVLTREPIDTIEVAEVAAAVDRIKRAVNSS